MSTIFSLSKNIQLIAQQNAIGNEYAQGILERSNTLTTNTAQSWDRIWDITVNPGEPLWQALVNIGALIATVSIIYLAVIEGDRLINNPTWRRLITMLRFPLGIVVLLGGNGFFLAGIVRYIRAVAYSILVQVLDFTFAGISISDALQKIQNTSVANARAREIFADCIDKTGLALNDCLTDPAKTQQATDLLQALSGANGQTAPLNGNLLTQTGNFLVGNLTGAIALPFLNIITVFLIGFQWAFINGIEVALLLTGLFAPVALGFSMIPSAGPTIFAWLSGYVALFLMQLGYVIIVGLTANILALTEQAGQPISSTITDIAFLVFLSIVAPTLAVAIAKAGGEALFDGISRATKTSIRIAASFAGIRV
ncbi:MAG: hypothetical protein QNJ53_17755 [Pleurocapsa sp. MO_192.B19]|nr:hypothetical protein [Pleurocapsa sp. MO_192.B19]